MQARGVHIRIGEPLAGICHPYVTLTSDMPGLTMTHRVEYPGDFDAYPNPVATATSCNYRDMREAALSRSTFFERFSRAIGVAPMEYLLTWRMALAKDLLRRNEGRIAEIAERVGYSSPAPSASPLLDTSVGRRRSTHARSGRPPTARKTAQPRPSLPWHTSRPQFRVSIFRPQKSSSGQVGADPFDRRWNSCRPEYEPRAWCREEGIQASATRPRAGLLRTHEG